MNLKEPSIGVATVVVNKDKILIGRDTRKGNNLFGVPGGHWHSGETLKECAIREVKEESGIICKNVKLISIYDFYRKDKEKSYISIGMKANYVSGETKDLVEEGRLEWNWYTPQEALKLYPPDIILIGRYLSNKIFE